MVVEADHDLLRERLIVWKGPLEFDIGHEGTPRCALADFAGGLGATDIVIDSLKDIAVDLIKDEVGSRVNIAFQETIASGIELCALHHQRKAQQGAGKPRSLADVYGSRWLTAGMGSVVLLWGEPGDLIVELRHLKQPVEEVGPFLIVHDHEHGHSTVHEQVDLEQALTRTVRGLTVADAACLLFEKVDPDRNEIEKTRRRLQALISTRRAIREDDADGTARYFARSEAA
jgi:replicative DNA helicase